MSALGINKRRFRRARATNIAARATCSDQTFTCGVENISFGGAFLRGPILALGSVVNIQIARPGMKKVISLVGRVVAVVEPREAAERRLSPGVGIAFDDCAPDDRPRFLQLLRELGVDESPLAVTEGQGSLPPIARAAAPAPARLPETGGSPPVLSRAQAPASAPSAATSAPAPATAPARIEEEQRLMFQIKQVFAELRAANAALAKKDAEIARLQSELERLRGGRG
jgi:hypothetical protein